MKRDTLPMSSGPASKQHVAPEQVTAWLRGFLQQEFAIAGDRLRLDVDLYQDLDLDSIDAAEIVLRFNDAFDRDIDIREFRRVRTLAQAIDLLHR